MEFIHLNHLLTLKPFEYDQAQKRIPFLNAVREVTDHHYRNCLPYQNLCRNRNFDPRSAQDPEALPYLPTAIFKNTLLLSIPEDQVFREINSSATSSGTPSRMALDRQTSSRQSKCFNKIVLERVGNRRYPFVVLDTPETVQRSARISARSSTIRSLLFCASRVDTCVDEVNGNLRLDEKTLDRLLREAEKESEAIVLFGFTYILYHHMVRPLMGKKLNYNLKGTKIIHIGGWKKLEAEKVSSEKLVQDCAGVFGVDKSDIIDLYGFTEQAGMIYPTCQAGLRHVPVWGEVIVRDPLNLNPLPEGEDGLLQFITPIQTSYPGHSVLTEDMGRVECIDTCTCGRKGKAFKVIGRAPNSEIRGCGDIIAEKFA